ncbi:hypothetical protein AAFF_G00089550 [Aldrovandia affinis]|uniref:Reverse transcriptase domain-containing protein n=1 Tax=Aldrovandia affinis TaxID=143900 RepID=A0AAD7WBX9_9TELE|nr:hypothetical protein AAFF_G00089550 [Aldrovandia affinis]
MKPLQFAYRTRPQRVFTNGTLSNTLYTCTGSPQGCVLSPLLFILYTNDCKSTHANCHLIKFADDTVLLSLLSGTEQNHGQALYNFIEWCNSALLELNVSKTKEMVIDFRRKPQRTDPVVIHCEEVDVMDQYKYLGTIFDNTLEFEQNTEAIIKKAHQRQYLI